MSQDLPPVEIGTFDRPFFKGIENEFSNINIETDSLKSMIGISGIMLSKTEKWVFDVATCQRY